MKEKERKTTTLMITTIVTEVNKRKVNERVTMNLLSQMDTKSDRDKNKTTKLRVRKVESMLCVCQTDKGRGGEGGRSLKTEKEIGSGTSEGKD